MRIGSDSPSNVLYPTMTFKAGVSLWFEHSAWIVIFRGMSSWLLLVSARMSDCYENHIFQIYIFMLLLSVHVCEGEGVLPEQSRSFISENTQHEDWLGY